ncbi:hypothetical protein, conserved [Babesia ovata]|uniref:C3H1-type domain-containing protein n=1 Tax=Babesia ovata TaxID=189622 RepID=A0A2H6KKG0_9APIC|nr:uncharacterized protein BOVATA_049760 [Babesia ovata]GBE63483.1 hypothetical protein, conserved [Babesia ovata]
MAAIKTQLEKEIKAVAGIINEKLTKISTALKHDKEVDADYGVGLKKTVGHDGEKASDCSIFADLFQLKNNITELGQNVNGVQKRVGLVGEELERCVKESIDMLVKAPRWAATIVDSLRKEVNAKIEQMFRHVQDEAKKLYTNRKKIELSALHEIVTDQLKQITEIIKNDLNTGLKGFLNVLRDKHNGGQKLHDLKDKQNVESLSPKLKDYVYDIFQYVFIDLPKHLPYSQYSPQLSAIHSAVATLLSHLSDKKHFTHEVPGMLQKLKTSVQALHSTAFASPAYPVLDAFPKSLVKFVEQLEKGYVSTYSRRIINWQDATETKCCARIFLTLLYTLFNDLTQLKGECTKRLSTRQINLSSDLGNILKRAGYTVPSGPEKQDAQLQNKNTMTGQTIDNLLAGTVVSAKHTINVMATLDALFSHLCTYNRVCHVTILKSPKTPCNIHDMLCWISGLKYNAVFDELKKYCNAYDAKDDSLLKRNLSNAVAYGLPDLATYSHKLVITILGHGNASTMYACDITNNSLKFRYPTSGEECLHTLLDLLYRLLPVLRFLHTQCNNKPEHHGWRDCQYGENIPTAKWPCTDHPTDKANSQPTSQANIQPTCESKCQPNNQAKCQPTSPLMSYLNDCLPGHLPHQLITVGCKPKCLTCPGSTPGMPCLTPLGFRGFSGSMRMGTDLCEIIDTFLSNFHLSCLFSLAPKPPSTLPEHFGFALSLVTGWLNNTTDIGNGVFTKSISDASIELYNQPSKLIDALRNAYANRQRNHGKKHTDSESCDLLSLSIDTACNAQLCGPFLQSLCSDRYHRLTNKHSDFYLSWATYLPWTFYIYLQSLLAEFQQISCRDWGCGRCQNGATCKTGQHGSFDTPCHCKSIVTCKGTMSALYKYGFTFGNASILNAKGNRKTCTKFNLLLKRIIRSDYFRTLFEKCDEFLWSIREPFSYLLLALWSLSLLYLLHITVVRLDVLRIRSHLRSPSSHRIAAQSLLAAARVRALANVKYFSP